MNYNNLFNWPEKPKKSNHKYDTEYKIPNIEKDLLQDDATNIIGDQKPTHIIIHEVSLGTGKTPRGYNKERYVKKIHKDSYAKEDDPAFEIGYHYLVTGEEIVQFIPDNKSTCHTGTEYGNHNSIGIERLVDVDTNYEQATHNQAVLVATLMLKHNIPLSNVIMHKQAQQEFGTDERKQNPKQCPSRMLAGFRGDFQDFKNEVMRCFMYGWICKDELDKETVNKLPVIMKVAQERFKGLNLKEERER